jgi:hypothetical protein
MTVATDESFAVATCAVRKCKAKLASVSRNACLCRGSSSYKNGDNPAVIVKGASGFLYIRMIPWWPSIFVVVIFKIQNPSQYVIVVFGSKEKQPKTKNENDH